MRSSLAHRSAPGMQCVLVGRGRHAGLRGGLCPPPASAKRSMEINQLGTSDIKVSEVCLGTMTFGEQNTEKESHRMLSTAKDQGVTFLDTAELYPVAPTAETQGRSSEFIGSWLCEQKRENIVIASKVCGRSSGLAWIPANRVEPRGQESNPVVDGTSIIEAAEGEMRRLQTDYIDLFQIHWSDRYLPGFGMSQYHASKEYEATSMDEQVGAMGKLIEQGKIRAWGLSNESSYGVVKMCDAADRLGVPRPVTIQNSFSLVHRSFESELAETCSPSNLNLGLLPWSAMAGGSLSGKYLNHMKPKGARFTLFAERYKRFNSVLVQLAVARYAEIAQDYGCTSAQLAYAFCKSRWYIPSTIIGATTGKQLHENLEAFSFELPEDVLEEIEQVHLLHRNPALYD